MFRSKDPESTAGVLCPVCIIRPIFQESDDAIQSTFFWKQKNHSV